MLKNTHLGLNRFIFKRNNIQKYIYTEIYLYIDIESIINASKLFKQIQLGCNYI